MSADVTAALGRMNSALGAVSIAVGEALRAAERREREAARRESEAQAVIADAERRVEHMTAELHRTRGGSDRSSADYRRGYLAGRAVANRGGGTDDLEADADKALSRRRNRSAL